MAFDYRLFAVPFIISGIISLVVALLVLQRLHVKGGLALALLMLQFAVWAGANAVRWSLVDPAAQVFWLMLAHAMLIPAPATFLIFVAQLTDTDRWLTRTSLLFLASEPIATILIIATNSSHLLYFSGFQPVAVRGFPEMAWGRGPWFWLNVACSYIFILVAAVILLRALLHAGPFVRVQLATVLAGCLLPWAVNIYALLAPSAGGQFELTPLAAAASGLIFAYALFRQRLLDIVPVARSLLFENLGDAVLVLDTNGRIVDANRAAKLVLRIQEDAYGRQIRDVVPQWRDFAPPSIAAGSETHFEVQGRLDPSRYYDVTAIDLRDARGRPNGRLISLRDITARRQTELELQRANLQLRRQVQKIGKLHAELQEQAIRDPLTGLYNRRYLDETLEREFSRARRAGYPISMLMMDVDQFKAVNDTYGHKAGDRVLRSLGEIIELCIRQSDIPCRFGGEEFVIVMPETSIETAAQRAEQIRLRFYSARFFKGGPPLTPTLSIGIAAYPAQGHSSGKLLHAADVAMYTAKSHGGNRTIRYDQRGRIPVPASSRNVHR